MRIAYPMRVDAFDKPGGDLHQVQAYVEAGRRIKRHSCLPFDGEIVTDLNTDLSRFDIVHLTNLDRPVEAFAYYQSARTAGKPIILSAIHHSYDEIERYERHGRKGAIGFASQHLSFQQLEFLRSLLRTTAHSELIRPTARMMMYGLCRAQLTMLSGVDLILVLTEKERLDILKDFGDLPNQRFICVRNGYVSSGQDFSDANNPQRDIDICVVGRIEARKNQINILEATERLKLAAVFIGHENTNHKAYCRTFQARLNLSKSLHLGGLSHMDTLEYMRRSKVHVSASWFEVSPLVDLEAHMSGCAVVASKCGGTYELLGSDAEYVDPGSVEGIQRGISAALARSARDAAANIESRLLDLESWDAVGEQLAAIYEKLRNSALRV